MPTITTEYIGDMLFKTQLGNHALLTDVPASLGGKDRGPESSELFIASLGSCIGSVVANYCKASNINTDDLSVDVYYETSADSPTRLTNVRITLNMPHGSFAHREAAIKHVMEHCSIHETILDWENIDFILRDEEVEML